MESPRVENEEPGHVQSSSPLSSIQGLELADGSNAEMPSVEDMKLSSPSQSKESPPPKAPSPEANSPETKSPKAKSPKKKRVLVKRVRKSRWNAENILSDPKSPLASAELRTVLTNPMAWDVLNSEDKVEILALFPDNQHILSAGTDNAQLDFASLRNDDSFRYDCAAYTDGIKQGKHDPEWLSSAWCAHERRKMGDFDEHVENKFKEDWDVELPEEMRCRRELPTVNGSNEKRESSETKEGHTSSKCEDEIMTDVPTTTNMEQSEEDERKKIDDADMSNMQNEVENGDHDQNGHKDEAMDEPPKSAEQQTEVYVKQTDDVVVDELQDAENNTIQVQTDAEPKTTTIRRPRRTIKRVTYVESNSSEDELAQ